MRRRRRAPWAALLLATLGPAACNSLLDNHDRQLGEHDSLADGGPNRRDSGKDVDPGDDASEPPIDADVPDDGAPSPITIVVPNNWKSLNGATFSTSDAGVMITGYTSAGHAAIVPAPSQPSIPAEDYTVVATVRAPSNAEFGILARMQTDGSCALLGSKFGSETRPWVAYMSASDWNPFLLNLGPPYTFTPNARYKMKLRVAGDQATGKIWNATQAEPAGWQTIGTVPWKTGRGVGYYVYGAYDAVLESLQITVP
jgi:hypothetical protein